MKTRGYDKRNDKNRTNKYTKRNELKKKNISIYKTHVYTVQSNPIPSHPIQYNTDQYKNKSRGIRVNVADRISNFNMKIKSIRYRLFTYSMNVVIVSSLFFFVFFPLFFRFSVFAGCRLLNIYFFLFHLFMLGSSSPKLFQKALVEFLERSVGTQSLVNECAFRHVCVYWKYNEHFPQTT